MSRYLKILTCTNKHTPTETMVLRFSWKYYGHGKMRKHHYRVWRHRKFYSVAYRKKDFHEPLQNGSWHILLAHPNCLLCSITFHHHGFFFLFFFKLQSRFHNTGSPTKLMDSYCKKCDACKVSKKRATWYSFTNWPNKGMYGTYFL